MYVKKILVQTLDSLILASNSDSKNLKQYFKLKSSNPTLAVE